MLSCGILFSAPSFWMGGGLENRCVSHVFGADDAMRLALDVELQHMAFCTKFLDGWWS